MSQTKMLKEILEQPELIQHCLEVNQDKIQKIGEEIRAFAPASILFTARGTSLHSAVYGEYLFQLHCHIPTMLATESVFTVYDETVDLSHTLVIAISQSGKGLDNRKVLEKAKEKGAFTLAITNTPNSPVDEMAEHHIYTEVGLAESGAATKTYTATMTVLTKLVEAITQTELISNQAIINSIEEGIRYQQEMKEWAEDFHDTDFAITIARGKSFSLAREVALKLEETCQFPVLAYPASEFCHGPLSIVKEGTPVILFAVDSKTNPDLSRVLGYLSELAANTYLITNEEKIAEKSENAIILKGNDFETMFSAIVLLQLFSCYTATNRGTLQDHYEVLKGKTTTF